MTGKTQTGHPRSKIGGRKAVVRGRAQPESRFRLLQALHELQRAHDQLLGSVAPRCNAKCVLPARKPQSRMAPRVCEPTLGVAMGKVKHGLPHFTVPDFRRTARTLLAALGVEPHVAERCRTTSCEPAHRRRKATVAGERLGAIHAPRQGRGSRYNRHDYFEERRRALEAWGQLLLKQERKGPLPNEPAATHQRATAAQEA